jgi:hypothetical protein
MIPIDCVAIPAAVIDAVPIAVQYLLQYTMIGVCLLLQDLVQRCLHGGGGDKVLQYLL